MDQGRQATDEDARKSIRAGGNHKAPFTEAGYTDATGIMSSRSRRLAQGLGPSMKIPAYTPCLSPPPSKIASIKRVIKKRLPDWCVLLREWRKAHGKFPKIIRPVTFNEKLLHRNLFDRRAVFTQLADKAAVRSYVEQRLGPQILPKVYYLTSHPYTISFHDLPDRFVVKPTHGSGWVKIVTDKSTLDQRALMELCFDWLTQSYYKETREWVYKHIEPRIIVEELIDDGSGAAPNDYKLFVFGGTVQFIQVDVGRFSHHRRRLYTPTWEKIDALYEFDDIIGDVPRPSHLADMITAAETLGRDLDFVRADFYDTADRFYFGELTMVPAGGEGRFRPEEFDRYLGGLWKISAQYRFRSISLLLGGL